MVYHEISHKPRDFSRSSFWTTANLHVALSVNVFFFLEQLSIWTLNVILIASAFGKGVVFLFTRYKVELVGGIGPTVGKVMYLDMIEIWYGSDADCMKYPKIPS